MIEIEDYNISEVYATLLGAGRCKEVVYTPDTSYPTWSYGSGDSGHIPSPKSLVGKSLEIFGFCFRRHPLDENGNTLNRFFPLGEDHSVVLDAHISYGTPLVTVPYRGANGDLRKDYFYLPRSSSGQEVAELEKVLRYNFGEENRIVDNVLEDIQTYHSLPEGSPQKRSWNELIDPSFSTSLYPDGVYEGECQRCDGVATGVYGFRYENLNACGSIFGSMYMCDDCLKEFQHDDHSDCVYNFCYSCVGGYYDAIDTISFSDNDKNFLTQLFGSSAPGIINDFEEDAIKNGPVCREFIQRFEEFIKNR